MSLMYPPFAQSEEFNCLDGSLEFVTWWNERQRLLRKRSKAMEQVDEAKAQIKTQIPAICEQLIEDTAARYPSPPVENIRERLGDLIEQYRKTLHRPTSDASAQYRRNSFTDDVAAICSQVATDKLIDACKLLCSEESKASNKASEKALSKAQKLVDEIDAKLSAMLNVVTGFFVDGKPPKTFRGLVLNKNVDATEMAINVITSFISEWTTRATQFEVPVTISGHAILSLPSKRLQLWRQAYESLGLQELKKRAVYIALKSPEIDDSALPIHAGIGAFGIPVVAEASTEVVTE